MKRRNSLKMALAALAIAVPMAVQLAAPASVSAEVVNFSKLEAETNNPVEGAVMYFYSTGGTNKKIFSAKTGTNGKLVPSSVQAFNGFNAKGVVKEDGNLDLKNGDYMYVEFKAPAGYMVNNQHVKFSVSNGVAPDIQVFNTKFPEGKGQLIITSIDKKTGAPVAGSVLDLYKKNASGTYIRVASFNSDNSGLLMSSFAQTGEDDSANLEIINGTVALSSGSYMVQESSAGSGYATNKGAYYVKVDKGTTQKVDVGHDRSSNVSGQKSDTGVKIRVVNTNNSGVSNQEIAVYSVDDNWKNEQVIFVGKTGTDGYFDTTKATTGSDLLNNSVLEIKPGKYYYKLNNISGAKNHYFTVTDGKIGNQVLKLSTTSTTGNSSSTKSTSTTSNNAKTSSLAKTGMKSTAIFSAIGVSLMAGGVILYRKK